MPFTTLIPAAGRSQRMGYAKAWLHWRGAPLIQHIVSTAARAGTAHIVIVAGALDSGSAHAKSDTALVTRIDVAAHFAPFHSLPRISVPIGSPDGHLIDSIRAGLEYVQADHDLLLWPVDQPFAKATVIAKLGEAFDGNHAQIAVPMVGERAGHPVLFGRDIVPEFTSPTADGGANRLVRSDPRRVVQVSFKDPRLVANLNTDAEAARFNVRPPQ